MIAPVDIVLTKGEMFYGAIAGVMRNVSSVFAGSKPNFGYKGECWGLHIEGACGEIAVAKAIDRYWSPSVNTFSAADIGQNIQVRTRSKDEYELIVRPTDSADHIFVLVTGLAPYFTVRGWINGKDAQRDEWWHEHGGRPGAWFVPQDALNLDLGGINERHSEGPIGDGGYGTPLRHGTTQL